MRVFRHLLIVATFVFFVLVVAAEAQRYRYMDSSGNIHFVEALSDVPRQYRQQIAPATPTPVLDARQQRERQKVRERELREQQRRLDNKRRELDSTRRVIERERKRQPDRAGSAMSDSPKTDKQPATREDQIEVIR